ncbi:MAG: cobyric acid synthase [Alphaproteobacteria bacterium]|nr:cobyric acid synthase [Alphaproteobacteria bacterium]
MVGNNSSCPVRWGKCNVVARSLMLQGTGSDVGKSVLVAGLCRAFHRRGLRVRPFKPQNMSNNAAVAQGGGEIGRAQWLQAKAACVAPNVDMNPVLLKPESDTGAQIIVHGQMFGRAEADTYQRCKGELLGYVVDSFEKLKAEADLILVEGAGSPAEVNLRATDIANMGFALPTNTPVALVGDINRGGVIAAIAGTYALLPDEERSLIRGVIINQFRGDVRLFDGGIETIRQVTGWQNYGVVPFLRCVRELPAEDAVVLEGQTSKKQGRLLVAVPLLPRIANFDDLDPLRAVPDVDVVFVRPGTPLPRDAALVVLPGSKATIADLRFMKAEGWDIDIRAHVRAGGQVLGLCGGYQMLGTIVCDPFGVEGGGEEPGLGLLDVKTELLPDKQVTETVGSAPWCGEVVTGYEIHAGKTVGEGLKNPFLVSGDVPLGAMSADGHVMGTYMHGLFEKGAFLEAFLARLGRQVRGVPDHGAKVNKALDTLAEELEKHLDLDALYAASR